jgi:hypothetical protein
MHCRLYVAIRDLLSLSLSQAKAPRQLPEPQINGNLDAGPALSAQAMEFCEQRDNAKESGSA